MKRVLCGLMAVILVACAGKAPLPPRKPWVPPPPPAIEVVGLSTSGFSSISVHLRNALNAQDWTGLIRPDYVDITADLLWVQLNPDARFTRSLKVAFKAYNKGTRYASAEFQTNMTEAAEQGKDMGQLLTERILEHLRKQS